jgi:hypothetical protein
LGRAPSTGAYSSTNPCAGLAPPVLIIAPYLRRTFVVDHTQYDTTSILATIEARFGLEALSSRDGEVNDMSKVFSAKT